MKKTIKKLAILLMFACLGAVSSKAAPLFYDPLLYPNGLIETDGLWQVYSPAPPLAPYGDCFVSNNLIQLVKGNHDAVDAPFTNNTGNTLVYASFTINVTALPTSAGSYFAEFQDPTDYADVAHLFAGTAGTSTPGTYRLGIANYATASTSAYFFPMDLATNTTYYVVMAYDPNNSDSYPGATMVVNPASESDFDDSPAYGRDNTPSSYQLAVTNSAIAFSPYVTAGIGDVYVGTAFSDVFPYAPVAPVFGIQPQSTNIYSGNSDTLYAVASGFGTETYQWYSNSVALGDNGTTVIGSASNILVLSNLQNTATYSCIATATGGSTTSSNAVISVNSTPTAPFFVTQPYGATNGNGSTITLSALANGTGPISYQWYFKATNAGTYSVSSTGPNLSLSPANYPESGSYYVVASNSVSTATSVTVTVLVTPPPFEPISFLTAELRSNNIVLGPTNLANGEFFTVQGIVTSLGMLQSKTYSEYFVQDGTGGALVFVNGTGNTNSPAIGTMVQCIGIAQQYYGQLELAPVPTTPGTITILSSNNPVPAPVSVNLTNFVNGLTANAINPYALQLNGCLITMTNVYLYSTTNGAAVSGNWPTNSSKSLYAYEGPWSATAPYIEVFQYTATNVLNQFNTNFWGKPIPSRCVELTGALDFYAPNTPEICPSRYQDYVTATPATFNVTAAKGAGVSTISWPAVPGSTYSLYSAPSATGPWLQQQFGLSYYPSTGSVTVTNSGTAGFFLISSP
jgi:hypothetical protein